MQLRVFTFVKYMAQVIGAGLLSVAFFLYQSTSAFLDGAVVAQGTVTELIRSRSEDSVTYRPVVTFTAENGTEIEFLSSTGSNPPGYSPGERVEVLYQPESPAKAKLKTFFALWGAPLIVGGLGGAFFLSGLALFFAARAQRVNKEALMKNGMRIDASVQDVVRNKGFSVNGRYPYRITAQWLNPSSMELHLFESQNIWFDPSPYLARETVAVFIEPDAPGKYHMDVSFLPKLAK